MKSLAQHVDIHIPENLYIKNPKESELGNRLVQQAAAMIASAGIGAFNFKKLSIQCGCTEATVYRYFENKHKLLLYLLNLYWGWQEYRLVLQTQNITDHGKKLKKAISILAHLEIPDNLNSEFGGHIVQIAIQEGIAIHLTPEIQFEINNGSLTIYHILVKRLSKLIADKIPTYDYPDSLAAAIMDIALQQKYFMRHCPELSRQIKDENDLKQYLLSLIPKTA